MVINGMNSYLTFDKIDSLMKFELHILVQRHGRGFSFSYLACSGTFLPRRENIRIFMFGAALDVLISLKICPIFGV